MAEPRRGDSGVTLIEVLVVLALVGVTAGAVTYALPSTPSARSLEQEAALLTSKLNLAAEQSLTGGQTIRMAWTAAGYRFHRWEDGTWDAAGTGALAQDHRFARGATLTDGDGARDGHVTITPDLLPPQSGVARLSLEAGTATRIIRFDGAAARMAETNP